MAEGEPEPLAVIAGPAARRAAAARVGVAREGSWRGVVWCGVEEYIWRAGGGELELEVGGCSWRAGMEEEEWWWWW